MQEFEEQFIEEIKKYSFLYDLQDARYKKVDLKEKAWKDIGEKFNCSGITARTKFKSMRDYYYAIKRSQQTQFENAASAKKRKWRYFDLMKFLDSVKKEKPALNIINFTDVTNEGPADLTQYYSEITDEQSNISIDSDLNTSADNSKRKKTLPMADCSTAANNQCETIAPNMSAINCKASITADGLSSFFCSLTADIQAANLQPAKIRDLKLRVMNEVYTFIEVNSNEAEPFIETNPFEVHSFIKSEVHDN